jgi:hypothetical protein
MIRMVLHMTMDHERPRVHFLFDAFEIMLDLYAEICFWIYKFGVSISWQVYGGIIHCRLIMLHEVYGGVCELRIVAA